MSAHIARADSIINYAKRSGELKKFDDSDLSARLALAFECGILASNIRELCEEGSRLRVEILHLKLLNGQLRDMLPDEPEEVSEEVAEAEAAHERAYEKWKANRP